MTALSVSRSWHHVLIRVSSLSLNVFLKRILNDRANSAAAGIAGFTEVSAIREDPDWVKPLRAVYLGTVPGSEDQRGRWLL